MGPTMSMEYRDRHSLVVVVLIQVVTQPQAQRSAPIPSTSSSNDVVNLILGIHGRAVQGRGWEVSLSSTCHYQCRDHEIHKDSSRGPFGSDTRKRWIGGKGNALFTLDFTV
jgi:hypothetical protein